MNREGEEGSYGQEVHQDSDEQTQLEGPSEFGKWLSKTREQKGMTPSELSDKSGISCVQIYNLESGRSQNPQERTRKKLATALGVDVDASVVKATAASATIEDLGEFVDFDPHDPSDYPTEPGVYVFYDISDRPIYVGQSEDISHRIRQDHFTRFWFKAPIVQSASYLKISEARLRKQIESVMIKFLKSNAVVNKHYVQRSH